MKHGHGGIPFYWWRRLLQAHPRLAEAIFPEGMPPAFHMNDVRRADQYIEREFASLVGESAP